MNRIALVAMPTTPPRNAKPLMIANTAPNALVTGAGKALNISVTVLMPEAKALTAGMTTGKMDWPTATIRPAKAI